MLRATPKSWFSWSYHIHEGARRVATVDVAWVRERARVDIAGIEYELGREGLARGAFFLRREGVDLVRASKPSAFLRRFEIDCGGVRFGLRARGPFSRGFVVVDGRQVLGGIAPERIFSRKATVNLPKSMPLEVQVFLAWLVIVMWKRASNASHS